MGDIFDQNLECSPEKCENCPGCGMQGAPMPRSITLTMDDDTVVECAVLSIFPCEGQEYIAVAPVEEQGLNDSGEMYLYRYSQTEDGQPVLDNIEEEDEFDRAAEVFYSIMENAQTVAYADPQE